MYRAMQTYSELGFDGFFIDDHAPRSFQDTAWGHRVRAFANGYIQGLIEPVKKQSPDPTRGPFEPSYRRQHTVPVR